MPTKRGDKKEAKQLLERIARRLKKPPDCNAMKSDEWLNGGFLRRLP